MISIKECLAIMHSGAEFSLKAVQWDQRRHEKRGKLLVVECAVLVWGDGGSDRVLKYSERPPTALEKSLIGDLDVDKRNPNHMANYTRNIRLVVDGMKTESILKVHTALIVEFNGKETTA